MSRRMSSDDDDDVETDNGWDEVDTSGYVGWQRLENDETLETLLGSREQNCKRPYTPFSHDHKDNPGRNLLFNGTQQYIGRHIDQNGIFSFVGPAEQGVGLRFLPGIHTSPHDQNREKDYNVLVFTMRSDGEWPVEWRRVKPNGVMHGFPVSTDIEWNREKVYVGMRKDVGIGMVRKVANSWKFYSSSNNTVYDEFYVLCNN